MAYFTGTEVKVWIQTEHNNRGISIDTADEKLQIEENAADSGYNQAEIYGRSLIGKSGFNTPDITGIDLSTGTQDEEIAYFGTKTPGKIETKSDMSVTLTKKKSNKLFTTLAQGQTNSADSYGSGGHAGRHGINMTAGGTAGSDMKLADGTVDPKSSRDESDNVCYGYRVAIQLKADSTGTAKDGAVVVLRNCTMGEYSVALSNDAADEETIQFVSMVKPLILNGVLDGAAFDGGNTATPATEM